MDVYKNKRTGFGVEPRDDVKTKGYELIKKNKSNVCHAIKYSPHNNCPP